MNDEGRTIITHLRTLTLLGSVLVLTACVVAPERQYRWVSTGGEQQFFDQHFGQCEAQAMAYSPTVATERGVAIFMACMRGKGWRLLPV